MMLLTKYQGSRPCGFREEDFFMFSLIKAYMYVKHVILRVGPFLATWAYFEQTWQRFNR